MALAREALSEAQHDWLEDVYRTHVDAVLRTCLRFAAGDRAWALDRTHDTFFRFASEMERVREHGDPGGWLYRVAVNTCLMSLRRGRLWGRIAGVLGFERQGVPSAEAIVSARRDVSALEKHLPELPDKQRVVFVLVELEEKSQLEAAALLNLSKGQVSKLHSRALATLRHALGGDAND